MNRRTALALIGQSAFMATAASRIWAQPAGWPRRITGADGRAVELTALPQRILSSSVTLTGTALAIGAPVIASAATVNGQFFTQWAEQARDVERLWPAGRVDLESVLMLAPDLILVSASGADSALAHVAQFSAIAPTLILDYALQPWQALAMQIGQVTGREDQAAALLADYDRWIEDQRARMVLPPGQANIVSYNGPGMPNPVALATGVHGRLLASLGFQIEGPPPDWPGGDAAAGDFVRVAYEYLPDLTAETTFLLNAGQDRAEAFMVDPLLANLPSVRAGQVYALGETSFRIDYYSARQIVELLAARFASGRVG
ncbi:MAG: Fe2+-enterobactin ABC transporter substrate-binding protein [Paracoccus sp. (in: a-proteobacteria)]|nr:Fe2+-enterobactin ABC transporter substrate-binding protein [Paracoccus sp. (in: a-proteobacteria)]